MNTTQLSRAIARHLAVPDSSNLESDAILDVLNAINSGLHRFFMEAPSFLKRTTFSSTFKAPVSLSLNFSSQYSSTVLGTPFQAEWFGCGVKIAGIPQVNEITGPSSLLDEWLLPNLSVEAEILFDAQPINVMLERITSDVRAYNDQHPNGIVLQRYQGMTPWHRHWGPWMQARQPHWFYRLEPAAIVTGGNTTALLRIHPAPSVDTIVRFEAELAASSITATELIQGAGIPVADSWIPLLIPLCEEALTYSPLWRDPRSKEEIRRNAAMVIAERIKKLPQDSGVTGAAVGTPWGY